MNEETRTKNGTRNLITGIICQLILLVMPFINRTVMVYTLGAEFVGIPSLFTSLLTVLNIADLGFNAAIIYNMYAPIANNDKNQIAELLALFRKVYRIVGGVVFFGGLLVIPFLSILIKGDIPNSINIYVLYVLLLINSSLSYFLFAYKESILLADQRQDLSKLIRTSVIVIQYIVQFVILLIIKNFYAYVVIGLFGTIMTNLFIEIVVDKKYPYFKSVNNKCAKISKEMKRQISALLINRICTVTRNSLDNIIISYYIGLVSVTIYTNYIYIFNALYALVSVVGDALVASVGNSLVLETENKNYGDLKKLTFMHTWLFGWVSICLLCLYQPFMRIWMGKTLILSNYNMILICVYFYVINMCGIRNMYITASGTQEYYKKAYLLLTISNLVLNIVLGKFWGIAGIILATILTTFFIDYIYMNVIMFKITFIYNSCRDYLCMSFILMLQVALVGTITYIFSGTIKINGVWGIVIKGCICLVVPNSMFVLIWKNNEYYREIKKIVIKRLKIR